MIGWGIPELSADWMSVHDGDNMTSCETFDPRKRMNERLLHFSFAPFSHTHPTSPNYGPRGPQWWSGHVMWCDVKSGKTLGSTRFGATDCTFPIIFSTLPRLEAPSSAFQLAPPSPYNNHLKRLSTITPYIAKL
jgi:hypothetical protein